MREYIIRTASGDEFDIPYNKLCQVLRPTSYPSEIINGRGALRLKVEGCEVSFSPEPPGMHIVFESGEVSGDIADSIVGEILKSAERFTGEPGVLIPLH